MQDSTKQKVAHLITKGSPFGGAQTYVYTLATHLPEDRFESIVLCGLGDELPERLEASGVEVLHIADLKRDIDPFAEVRAFISLVKRLKELQP
ncbi:MAG: hypothetical protein RL292_97, partial [Candidatus Parcubacteria bacterium]